jgi:myo-inositol-1(or 4)-monophosphatase
VTDLAHLANVAATAAREAGALLRRRPARVDHKGAIDLVTEVDLASEACIREVLGRLTPDLPIQGEEGGGVTTGTRWVVDPLDGTTNFVHGYPAYVVSIGLVDGGDPVVGAIYDPSTDRLTLAHQGGGTTVNGAPTRVSEVSEVLQALGVTGFPYHVRGDAMFFLRYVEVVLRSAQGLRRSGSAAYDFTSVAAGHADFFWEFGLKPWDTSAGAIIVREAGGRVTTLEGGPWTPDDRAVLATNGRLHDAIVTLFEAGNGVG